MRFTKLLGLVSFVSVTALVGCGPSCEGLCDQAQDEECKNFDHDDCVHDCVTVEDFQEDTDKCDDEWDELLSCINDLSDICKYADAQDDSDKCSSEAKDFKECAIEYCEDHSSRDYCS